MDFYLKVKILTPGAKPPSKKDETDAGFDLWATKQLILPPLVGGVVPLGFCTEFPKGYVALMLDRSGMGFMGIMRRAGVIDCGYRGEWRASLFNSSPFPITIESVLENKSAKAACQVVFVPCPNVTPEIVEELSQSVRGENWAGSTDAKG